MSYSRFLVYLLYISLIWIGLLYIITFNPEMSALSSILILCLQLSHVLFLETKQDKQKKYELNVLNVLTKEDIVKKILKIVLILSLLIFGIYAVEELKKIFSKQIVMDLFYLISGAIWALQIQYAWLEKVKR